MATTKLVRVAVEGPTIDGRVIEGKHLTEMAETFSPSTYQPRVNVEHVRGLSGTPPFETLGDVIALKTQEVTLSIGGKDERRLALYAQIDLNESGMTLNKKGQKLFTSVEIQPEFAGTNKAALVGLALTDSPASIGTERLEFAAFKKKENLFSTALETEVALEVETAPADAGAASFGASVAAFFKQFTPANPVTPPAPVEATAVPQTAVASFAALQPMFEQFATSLTSLSAKLDALTAAETARAADFAKLKGELEATPEGQPPRPKALGGDKDFSMQGVC